MSGFGWFLFVVAALAVAFGLLILPHNVRVRRAREAGRRFPDPDRARVLELIRAAACERRWATLWIRSRGAGPGPVHGSRIGGVPYTQAGDAWPTPPPPEPAPEPPGAEAGPEPPVKAESPPPFMLQLRLTDPSLGPAWLGRLVQVFYREDQILIVRTYRDPDPARHVEPTGGPEALEAMTLEDLPIPTPTSTGASLTEDELDSLPCEFSPGALLRSVADLEPLLVAHCQDPQGLLTQILSPEAYGYDLDASGVIYEGGEPSLIQDVHDATCTTCRTRMRFLFQFGDVLPGLPLGDAGVGYVYGCDTHPDRPLCLVDSH